MKECDPVYGCNVAQELYACLLSCSDSRVIPEKNFDAAEGDLFVARLVGNVADTPSTASFEYAVSVLCVPLILVLGHECCGAVDGAIKLMTTRETTDFGINLNQLLSNIIPAINAPEDNDAVTVTKSNAINAAKSLLDQRAPLRTALEDGKLWVCAGYDHLAAGRVEILDKSWED
jgi:carbonic anhydrase